MTTEGDDKLRNDKILSFIFAATADPTLVHEYREHGPGYLKEHWGFTDEDIRHIQEYKPPPEESSSPTLAATIWPQPPIVWPRPPTIWQ